MSKFSRAMSASVLTLSLLASSIAAVAQTPVPADGEQSKAEQSKKVAEQSKNTSQNKSDEKKTQPAKSTKPLSDSENPAMIGKRKINSGLIASMSGSIEKEVRLGRQIAAEVDRQAKFVEDPLITEYVNRVGQNIVLHSDSKVPFTIKVIDSDEVNAFALPGGFFYVNRGLILAADNEAELAGVMAHEIAHVAARHAVENQTKASLLEYAAIGGSIFLGCIPG
jgi:predicted Zn-dependent protease